MNNFGLFWSFLKPRRRATLLSWTFAGDMNWAKSSQHPYALGLTWEPLWNRIPRENDENSNNFGLFDHFWSLCDGQQIVSHRKNSIRSRKIWSLRKNTSSRKNSKYHFTDLYFFWLFCAFSRTWFLFSDLNVFQRIFFPDNRGTKKKQVRKDVQV